MAERTAGLKQAGAAPKEREALWTLPYVLVCASQFLSFANNVMLHPVLPLYLTSIGLTPSFVGMTIVAFGLASFVSRPLLGQRVDRWTPRGVYVLGGLVLGLSSISYLLAGAAVLLLVRVTHGLGWAAINTAGAAIVSEITPSKRRGEAVGYFGMMRGLATALGPAVGIWLVAVAGFPIAFSISAALGLAATCTAGRISIAPRAPAPVKPSGLWLGLVEPSVALPTILRIFLNTTHPIATVFVALYASARGIDIGNFTIYFLASGLAMMAGQFLVRLSDRRGRAPVLAAGFLLSTLGFVAMLSAAALPQLVLGGMLWSAGVGLLEPTALALAIDKTPPGRRGAGMATYTAAFPIGTILGGIIWGPVIQWWGYETMFLGAIAMLLAGLLVLGTNWRSAGGMAPQRL